jgi:CHAT domain-containing protein
MRQRYRDLAAALPILSRAGLHHAAVFLGREAIAVADLEKDATWMAQARGFTAVAFEEAGDFETAKALLNESRSTAESIENEATRQKNIAFAELRSGDVEYAAGDYAAAARSYSEAAAIYDSGVEIPVNSEQAHVGKLRSDLALGKTEELEAQIPVTIQLTEKRRLGIRDESQQMGFFDSRINVYDIAAVFELSRGNAEAAYNYAETSSSRSLLDHMLSGLDRVDSGNGEQLLLHGNANPLKLDQIRGQVPIDAQVIQYSVFSDKLVIWLISQNEFSYFSQPISAKDLATKVNAYASLVSQPNSNPEEEQAGARELYDLLIAPVRERLRPDGEVCIVPSRVLFEIPFAALLTPDGERLIKKFSIIYSPSANVFVSATTLAGQKTIPVSDESILAVGDPAFDHNRHPGLPSLSDAAVESQRVSKIYGAKSRALVGRSAMKSTFLDNVDTADIVHFAGHYVAQTSSPMSSYLLFASSGDAVGSDELTDLELAAVSFKHTRLVVLAACDSGAESWYEGEGMIGAARSLLAAGVPLVVASQWAVDSRATSELMIRFHQNRHFQHQPTAAALRDAQLAMIDDQRLGYASPYYWAGFGVFGGAANF